MTRAWALLLLVLFMPGSALSDSSNLEGGVFIAHHPPGLLYSSGQDWCARYFQEFAIDSCEEQNNRIDLDGNDGEESVWFVLAAWDEPKEWCGAEFGLANYDSTIYVFEEWGPCFPSLGMEIPMEGWPGPNKGTAITTQDAHWSGNFLPIYFFAGYAYYQGTVPLAASPASGFGGTANCEVPPQSWAAAAFGAIGLFEDGVVVCSEGLAEGDGGIHGGTPEPDGAEGPGGLEGGTDGDGADETVACCFGAECEQLTPADCERAGGFARPGWASCDLMPCMNALADSSGRHPPQELYPLASRVLYASTLPYLNQSVFYLDPGSDNALSFYLCTMWPKDATTTLSIALYYPREESGEPFYSSENQIVGFPGLAFTGIPWERAAGMAKLGTCSPKVDPSGDTSPLLA